MTRLDGRSPETPREFSLQRDFTEMALGSVLVSSGRTRVLCTASVDTEVPRWMRGTGRGWVSAEYSLLPGSTPERASREAAKGRQSGRTLEIQRLIARSLRCVVNLEAMPDILVTVDCDVLQADGGTRTAAVSGGFVALHDALTRLVHRGVLPAHPVTDLVAAVSVGVVGGEILVDLPYEEDSRAETDMNVVMTGAGRFVEIQGTAEREAFSREELDGMLALAQSAITSIHGVQRLLLETPPTPR
jgi:ribonuclease PH